MATTNGSKPWGLGTHILEYRLLIGLTLIAITAFMGYWALRVQIATRFENFFPGRHIDTQLYRDYHYQYGGAQQLLVMLRVKRGDIFNFKTLHKIQDMHGDVNSLPGVDHNSIFSLASYRVAYATAIPGAIVSRTFMYPEVPKNQAELDTLRHNVFAHHEQVASLITYDNKGLLVTASFNERRLDYKALFDAVNGIIHKYQDDNAEIYVAGQPMISGWGYYYLPRITAIFVTSIVLMLVIPFILTARDLSHGIQWQGRYYDELDRLDDKLLACATTTDVMLPPGLLSILADIAGIIFISFGGIPVLKEIGLAGAVWLASSLTMVFVFQPIFMSYLPRPRIRERKWSTGSGEGRRTNSHRFVDWLVRVPVTPGWVRSFLLFGGVAFIIWGVVSGQRAHIGYEAPGTPLYKPDSKVNQDIAEIGKFFPTDEGWVVLSTTDYPDAESGISPNVLRMTDDMGAYLLSRGDALAVVSFASLAIKPLNMMFHNGFPKYRSIPSGAERSRFQNFSISVELGGNLWFMFFAGTAPGEIERFFAYSPKMTSSCVRVMLADHTYSRLNRLRDDIEAFVAERVRSDPNLRRVEVRYLGGLAGLYLGANDVLKYLEFINITFVLLVIYLCCALTFRSPLAGLLFIDRA